MSQLELDYPSVSFVYMTGHLDGSREVGNLNIRNEQIRTFCENNDKILYDFADIESYDPDGAVNYMPMRCTDNCDYDANMDGSLDSNWATTGRTLTRENGTPAIRRIPSRLTPTARRTQPGTCGQAWRMGRQLI